MVFIMSSWVRGLALAAYLVASVSGARGEGIYKYVEKDGTIVYTNVPPNKAAKVQKLAASFHKAPEAAEPAATSATSLTDFDDHIETAAKRYRIPPSLLRAVMHAESNFDPGAVSPKGAAGLMQLMPDTAREMYVKDIFEPRDNIEGGARYLRVLANQFDGDMVKMVAAYNAGPDAVNRFGGQIPPYPETQAYVRKVLQLYFQYKELGRLAETQPK
jgi:soluble lytic murein transglycosylase-like protein